ncbi:GNAT family N-acetyltransferase [Streptomyces sp. NPDC060031]|uniref:GNAT family N-acetyltransferase n=1 Tax=Streptomyces sp. NPDC060031 TaxID=3347043 RepID=UPI0036A3DF18
MGSTAPQVQGGKAAAAHRRGLIHLEPLYAMPEIWGTGIGEQLMLAALTALGQADYAQAALWVLEDNERARRFYEAAGWGPDGAAVEDSTEGASLNKLRYRRSLG